MRKLFILSIAMFAMVSMADVLNTDDPFPQVAAYLEINDHESSEVEIDVTVDKKVSFRVWPAGLSIPTSWPDYSIAKLPSGSRKIVDGQIVAKTSAELIADDIAVNGPKYAYQNAFLALCDTLKGTNTHEKLSFEEIPAYLKPIRSINRDQYDILKDALSTINMALVEKSGTKWWQSCVWTDNAVVISNTTVILNTLTNP